MPELVARLIQRGIAAEHQAAKAQRYHDLDFLAGTWSAEETHAFGETTTDFAKIDIMLWQ